MVRKMLFVGGGSGGHVIPNLALIQQLPQDIQVLYLGTKAERYLTSNPRLRLVCIPAGKLRRYWSWQNLGDIFRILGGFGVALWHILRFRPQVIFSKGGFASVPVTWAGWLARVPVVTHESDSVPGLATRLILPVARLLITAFPLTIKRKIPVKQLGIPLREAVVSSRSEDGRRFLRIGEQEKILLVIGGSLGAESLNQAVVKILPEILSNYEVVHLTGRGKRVDFLHPRYHQYEYLDQELSGVMAAADLVVTRGGATVLFELATLRKPMIIVPLGGGASRGEQGHNAEIFAQTLGVVNLEGKNLEQDLRNAILQYNFSAVHFTAFDSRQATAKIVQELLTFLP